MAFLFTDHQGEVLEVNPTTLPSSISSSQPNSINGVSIQNMTQEAQEQATENVAAPIITVTEPIINPVLQRTKAQRRTVSDQSGNASGAEPIWAVLGYNAYGELVDMEKLRRPQNHTELTVTETMRLICRSYHHELRSRMGAAIAVAEEVRVFYDKQIVLWGFKAMPIEEPPREGPQSVCVYKGPLRALEIGCGDGSWCFLLKKQHPEWIVEGVDDVDNWSRQFPDTKFRDFMESDDIEETKGYFGRVHLSQDNVEFTVRDLNTLSTHAKPLPHHIYSVIRARDIFSKIESYKSFLEDVRCLLQPEGVFELVEIDPRPRISISKRRRSIHESHISRAATDWTDNIEDRFKDFSEEQLAGMVPAWTRRVEERLKAAMRPRDGIAAMHLKSWLEGAGFHDVKQLILRLPVGGNSASGKKLLEVMAYQSELENSIPLLAATLPTIDLDALNFGNYYVNMHVITGRKARYPRPGDLLLDGTRQGMTPLTYDVMNRLRSGSSNQWSRTVLDGDLASSIRALQSLRGGPGGSGGFEMAGPPAGAGMPRAVRLERKVGRLERQIRDRSSA